MYKQANMIKLGSEIPTKTGWLEVTGWDGTTVTAEEYTIQDDHHYRKENRILKMTLREIGNILKQKDGVDHTVIFVQRKGVITAILCKPRRLPQRILVPNTLEDLQEMVGGYIETVTYPEEDMVVICDEEGRFKGEDHCGWIDGTEFVGTILIVGQEGDEFTDCPYTLNEFMKAHPEVIL